MCRVNEGGGGGGGSCEEATGQSATVSFRDG
jgi:hypothetical protein